MAVGYLFKKFPAMYVTRRFVGACSSLGGGGGSYYSRSIHSSVYACGKKRRVEPFYTQLHTTYIDKIQENATVCKYLFTAKSLYLFRVSIAPIIFLQRGQSGHVGGRLLPRYYDLYQRLQLQFYVLLMMGAMDTRNM